ncbi:MAG: hypothetical protein IK073_06005 [Paludibacteraceae bacterium]|nr:hypothetical protein [Paludibacteraceae bacterium]
MIIDCLPDFEGNIIININVVSASELSSLYPVTGNPLPVTHPSLFSRITQAAYDKGVAQNVEDELRGACTSAPKLIKTIRFNESMGYLNTQNLSSAFLYRLLDEHFGLPFKLRTFQDNRSK